MVGALGPITVAIVSITLTWAGHLRSRAGIKAVGHIDAGLPPFTVWHPGLAHTYEPPCEGQPWHCMAVPTCLGVKSCSVVAQQSARHTLKEGCSWLSHVGRRCRTSHAVACR